MNLTIRDLLTVVSILLVIGSLFIAAGGLAFLVLLSRETLGIGLIVLACFVGILARLAQAASLIVVGNVWGTQGKTR
mgnify:CR=1 FL=1